MARMYLKRHAVTKGGKRYVYLRLVEAFRDESGRVRHRVLRTLGREDELKASGQLEQLAASFARLDPPPAGTRRHVGPLLLVGHYLNRLGLVELIDAAAPMRGRAMLTHGEVIAALVSNRLCGPAPLYDVAGWASSAAMAELFGIPAGLLNDDRLGRALEALAPVAEQVRGELALAAASRCGADLSRLHLDMTAVRFTGGYAGSALVEKGWAADRTIARQIKTMQVSTRAGVAVYYRPHPGGSGEAPCFADTLERIRALAPPGVVCVIDSGFGYLGRLCAADAKGLRFVVPLRADTGWAGWFAADVPGGLAALHRLDHCSAREARLPEHERTVWKGALRERQIADADTGATHRLRIAYIWSSEEAASVAEARERALTKAQEALTRIHNGLGGRYYKTKKQVDDRVATIIGHRIAELITVTTGLTKDGKPTITWRRNPEAITSASTLDGLYALATNLPDPPEGTLTALDVLNIYKDQWIVEQRHRDLKQTLHVRPIFLHNDDRIHALIAVIGIALLIYGLIEADLRAALGPNTALPGLLPEHRDAVPTARAVLTAFTDLHATYTTDGLVLDQLTTVQRLILAHLNIPLPWPETRSTTTTPKTANLNPQLCGKRA
jgi:transposase